MGRSHPAGAATRMTMTPTLRRSFLTLHVLASVGWAGAVAVFVAHSIATMAATDPRVVRAAAWAMNMAAWYVILPLAVAGLVTGVVQALGTPWGLFRHYWVAFKLVFTVVATVVLLTKLGPISMLAEAASLGDAVASQGGLRVSLLLHAVGALVVLTATTALAIFKPAGRIGRGVIPIWVRRVLGVMGILLVALVVMVIFGEHGSAMHGR